VQAGKFHNITVGSLLQLYKRPEQITSSNVDADSSIVWLRITKVDGTTSQAQAIRWEDDDRIKSVEAKLPTL
jgi:hypothetical protein